MFAQENPKRLLLSVTIIANSEIFTLLLFRENEQVIIDLFDQIDLTENLRK